MSALVLFNTSLLAQGYCCERDFSCCDGLNTVSEQQIELLLQLLVAPFEVIDAVEDTLMLEHGLVEIF